MEKRPMSVAVLQRPLQMLALMCAAERLGLVRTRQDDEALSQLDLIQEGEGPGDPAPR